MSAALARNWWAVGIRALSAAVVALSIAVLPRPSVAGLAVMLAVYIAADGAFAILAGRAARRDERWSMLVFEGTTNLLLACVILSWPAIAVIPLMNLLSAWAVVTGGCAAAGAIARSLGPDGERNSVGRLGNGRSCGGAVQRNRSGRCRPLGVGLLGSVRCRVARARHASATTAATQLVVNSRKAFRVARLPATYPCIPSLQSLLDCKLDGHAAY